MDEKRANIVNRAASILLGLVALWQCFIIYASTQFSNLLKSFELQQIFVDLMQVLQITVPFYFLLTLILAIHLWRNNKLKLGAAVLMISIVFVGTLFAQLAIQAVGYIPIFQEGSS